MRVGFDPNATEGGTNGRWKLIEAHYSAHDGSAANRTALYRASALQYPFNAYRDNPIAWVAEDNHANYRRQNECQSLITPEDVCSSTIKERLDILPTRNIGSAWAQLNNCVQSGRPGSDGYLGWECFWNEFDTFAGWRDGEEGTTPYGTFLRRFGWYTQFVFDG